MQKPSERHPRPTREYFSLYDQEGPGLAKRRYLHEALSVVRDRVGDILSLPHPIRLAMFGSATDRNVEDAEAFLADVRPDRVGHDRITVVERDEGRLALHAEHVRRYGRSDVELLAGDMNVPQLAPGSADIVVIDHTMAFNVALTEVAGLDVPATDALYRATIQSAAAALSPQGALVLNVNVHPQDDQGDYLLRYDEQFLLHSTAIREGRLHELLAEKGLDSGYSVEIPNVYWKPAKRMVVRHGAAVRAARDAA
jgi:hypothetical protein